MWLINPKPTQRTDGGSSEKRQWSLCKQRAREISRRHHQDTYTTAATLEISLSAFQRAEEHPAFTTDCRHFTPAHTHTHVVSEDPFPMCSWKRGEGMRRINCGKWDGLNFSLEGRDWPTTHPEYLAYSWRMQCKYPRSDHSNWSEHLLPLWPHEIRNFIARFLEKEMGNWERICSKTVPGRPSPAQPSN